MSVSICAELIWPHLAVADSKFVASVCGVPHWTIEYLPSIERPLWFPASGETELTEMSFCEGAVAEASFHNQKGFSIEQIIIHHASISVGKASQLQVMPFLWFGQWPSSDTYGYRDWRHVDFFSNVIWANCPSSFGRVLQKGGIKSRIFCLPRGQIQGWLFADIDVTEIDKERLPKSGPDIRIFGNNPSARATNHRVAADFYTFSDQSCLSIGDPPAIDHQFISQIRQTLSFERGAARSEKGEDKNDKVRPIQGIMLFGCGAVLGISGSFLAVIIAPVRGDAWGFAGLALIPIGLIICYFAGGFFIAHLAHSPNPAFTDPFALGYPTKSVPDRRSSRSSMILNISVIDHSL